MSFIAWISMSIFPIINQKGCLIYSAREVINMYRCPKCGSICNSSLVPTWNGAIQSWGCSCCGWSNLNVETKTGTSTENIDLGRVMTSTEAKT